jgi:hypothetical protein
MRTTVLACLAMLFLVGCGPRKVEYKVWVTNDTKTPLTIGLVKDGGPDQDMFITPEFLAMDTRIDPDKTAWGVLLIPGKTVPPNDGIVGLFDDAGQQAYLRVYRGEINLTEVLSISRGSPRRLDLPLPPEKSHFVIYEKNGRLEARQK